MEAHVFHHVLTIPLPVLLRISVKPVKLIVFNVHLVQSAPFVTLILVFLILHVSVHALMVIGLKIALFVPHVTPNVLNAQFHQQTAHNVHFQELTKHFYTEQLVYRSVQAKPS